MRADGFNADGRAAVLDGLPGEYDLVVVGGGINGCGIAREAACRGYRVLLLEKGDLGSGTSSRSSRLIHGGLRYLKHGQLKVVWEASVERHRLRSRYPHLVRPVPFVIPVYKGEGEGLLATLFGLALYDLLSGFTNVQGHDRLRAGEVLTLEPNLRREGLRGGGLYSDCWTDDFRLVLATAREAHAAGAHVVTYARVDSLLRTGGRVTGVGFTDVLRGDAHEVRARLVVNAAGPWSDRLRGLASREEVLRPTKGAHILLPRDRVGNEHAVVLHSPRDDRVVFVLPWGPLALVGTTDTDYGGDPDAVRPEAEDVAYLLETVNRGFPGADVGVDDVVSAYAALRPLTGRRDIPASRVSRDYRILRDAPGLLSVVGGKLTTFRRLARKVVRLAARRLPSPPRRRRPPVPEAPEAPEALRAWLLDRDDVAVGPPAADALVQAYGPRVREVVPYLRKAGGDRPLVEGLPYRWGQVAYAVDHEMALRVPDVLIRRTRLLHEDADHGRGVAEAVADTLGERLGWDPARRREEVAAFEAEVRGIEAFRGGG